MTLRNSNDRCASEVMDQQPTLLYGEAYNLPRFIPEDLKRGPGASNRLSQLHAATDAWVVRGIKKIHRAG